MACPYGIRHIIRQGHAMGCPYRVGHFNNGLCQFNDPMKMIGHNNKFMHNHILKLF